MKTRPYIKMLRHASPHLDLLNTYSKFEKFFLWNIERDIYVKKMFMKNLICFPRLSSEWIPNIFIVPVYHENEIAHILTCTCHIFVYTVETHLTTTSLMRPPQLKALFVQNRNFPSISCLILLH